MKKEKLKIVGVVAILLIVLWFVYDQLILDEDCEDEETEDEIDDDIDELFVGDLD